MAIATEWNGNCFSLNVCVGSSNELFGFEKPGTVCLQTKSPLSLQTVTFFY